MSVSSPQLVAATPSSEQLVPSIDFATMQELNDISTTLDRLAACCCVPNAVDCQPGDCRLEMEAVRNRIDLVCKSLAAQECDPAADVPELSPREREIVRWMARGKSNTVIAQILSISRHTVDTHLRRAFRKLGAADRTTAALRAMERGLL